MIDRNYAPRIIQIYADNGEHSHFRLIDIVTGETLWEEPEESMCDSEHIAPVVRSSATQEDTGSEKFKRERIKAIIEILRAVNVLEWHDKNFLCTPASLNSMKREHLNELEYLTEV